MQNNPGLEEGPIQKRKRSYSQQGDRPLKNGYYGPPGWISAGLRERVLNCFTSNPPTVISSHVFTLIPPLPTILQNH